MEHFNYFNICGFGLTYLYLFSLYVFKKEKKNMVKLQQWQSAMTDTICCCFTIRLFHNETERLWYHRKTVDIENVKQLWWKP